MTQQRRGSVWPQDTAQLAAIQAIFAVLMAIGFETMVQHVYQYFRPALGVFVAQPPPRAPWTFFMPIVAMSLLGLRFFWAVVNIRRYLEQAEAVVHATGGHRKALFERKVVLLHIPLLILHGWLFYFGSQFAADMLVSAESRRASVSFVVFYAGFQLLNVLWLASLVADFRSSVRREEREKFWIFNNLIASASGMLLAFIWKPLGMDHEWMLALACTVYVLSSVADLWRTAYHYLESPETRAVT